MPNSPRKSGATRLHAIKQVTDYVLAQRLARAYRRLVDPCHAGEKISTLAPGIG